MTNFYLEHLNNCKFQGYTKDEDWNGWAYPYFTYSESLKILEAQNQFGGHAWYDRDSDSFVFEIQEEKEEFLPISAEGQKLYPIGAGSWIWEEAGNQ